MRSTENMSGPGIGLGRVVLRDEAADRNARKIVEQRQHRLLHGAADILEIDVDAVRTGGFELLRKIGRAMIDAGIEAELVGYEAAFLGTAGDADRARSP